MPSAEMPNLTPMMQQWAKAKEEQHDAIVLFRMGDFYELFGDDALLAAPILELTLTSRDKDKSGLKMAGFPAFAAEGYIQKLVDHGHKVAVCEQLEDPKATKGIVKRGIVDVVTPGTRIESEDESDAGFSYLVGLVEDAGIYSICALDIKTGTFLATSSSDEQAIFDEARRLAPKEIIVARNDLNALELVRRLRATSGLGHIRLEERENKTSVLSERLKRIKDMSSSTHWPSISLVWHYVISLKGDVPEYIRAPKGYSLGNRLLLDVATQENLDLFPKKRGESHNLFTVLNNVKTSMGKRRLWEALRAPSTDLTEITKAQDVVAELLANVSLCNQLRGELSECHDVEKLTALVVAKKIGPRGLVRIRECLGVANRIKKITNAGVLGEIVATLPDLSQIFNSLVEALRDDAPPLVKDGNIFLRGFSLELDEQVSLRDKGSQLLVELEAREREAYQIPSLKIRYTRVFGYYIEITKSHLAKVPKHYQRKQTIANGERFVSEELSALEIKISSANEKVSFLEAELFEKIRAQVAAQASDFMVIGRILARIDLLASFATAAHEKGYVRPVMLPKTERKLEVTAGRHPIIEEICRRQGTMFVPNDFALNQEQCTLALITGPNMAGKSTIMRQVALMQIMAQMGSYVPAKSAAFSICDAIFARVGASDDLSTGRSTFMVEMSETAYILNNASDASLVLLDEIGRGTSTYDGMAIAQAVVEYIGQSIKARTLFATHYHELTTLEDTQPSVKNFHVEVESVRGDVTFLYTLAPGAATQSFGVDVAKLAGLPAQVIGRARDILGHFENKPVNPPAVTARPQLSLFSEMLGLNRDVENERTLQKFLGLDINRITPLDAINRLAALQKWMRSHEK